MDLQLDDQVVFVAGSTRGIGLAIASRLASEGACVVLTGRDEKALSIAFDELSAAFGQARLIAIAGDLTDRVAIGQAIDRTLSAFGHLDHVIANVGTGRGPLGWDVAEDDWDRLFEMNLFASTRLTQSVVPHLLDRGGSIIYVTSITAVEASAAPLPYSAAKAALANYAKNLARQLGPRKIRVNTIAPGNIVFDGGAWDQRLRDDPDAVGSMLRSEVPVGRFGVPDEIASLAAYLCSPLAAFATGGCYVVDGGQTRSV